MLYTDNKDLVMRNLYGIIGGFTRKNNITLPDDYYNNIEHIIDSHPKTLRDIYLSPYYTKVPNLYGVARLLYEHLRDIRDIEEVTYEISVKDEIFLLPIRETEPLKFLGDYIVEIPKALAYVFKNLEISLDDKFIEFLCYIEEVTAEDIKAFSSINKRIKGIVNLDEVLNIIISNPFMLPYFEMDNSVQGAPKINYSYASSDIRLARELAYIELHNLRGFADILRHNLAITSPPKNILSYRKAVSILSGINYSDTLLSEDEHLDGIYVKGLENVVNHIINKRDLIFSYDINKVSESTYVIDITNNELLESSKGDTIDVNNCDTDGVIGINLTLEDITEKLRLLNTLRVTISSATKIEPALIFTEDTLVKIFTGSKLLMRLELQKILNFEYAYLFESEFALENAILTILLKSKDIVNISCFKVSDRYIIDVKCNEENCTSKMKNFE